MLQHIIEIFFPNLIKDTYLIYATIRMWDFFALEVTAVRLKTPIILVNFSKIGKIW